MTSPLAEGFVLAALSRSESLDDELLDAAPRALAREARELAARLSTMSRREKDRWTRGALQAPNATTEGYASLPPRARALLGATPLADAAEVAETAAIRVRRGYRLEKPLHQTLLGLAALPSEPDAERAERAEGLAWIVRSRGTGWCADLEASLLAEDRTLIEEARYASESCSASTVGDRAQRLLRALAAIARSHPADAERLRVFGALCLGASRALGAQHDDAARQTQATEPKADTRRSFVGGDERSRPWRRAGQELAELFEDTWLES